MREVFFVTALAVMHASSALACSIDELKKLTDAHLERFPSSAEREFAPPGPDDHSEGGGGSWQVFEREDGTPHSIVVTIRNELGQDKIRVSFLNRKDFVIVDAGFYYSEMVQEKEEQKGKYIFGSAPNYYFFCGGEIEVPANAKRPADVASSGNYWKDFIFKSDELKADIARVPE